MSTAAGSSKNLRILFDVLFVGGDELSAEIIPAEFYSKFRLTSYNLSSTKLLPEVKQYVFSELLKKQDLKAVVIDAEDLYTSAEKLDIDYSESVLAGTPLSFNKIG